MAHRQQQRKRAAIEQAKRREAARQRAAVARRTSVADRKPWTAGHLAGDDPRSILHSYYVNGGTIDGSNPVYGIEPDGSPTQEITLAGYERHGVCVNCHPSSTQSGAATDLELFDAQQRYLDTHRLTSEELLAQQQQREAARFAQAMQSLTPEQVTQLMQLRAPRGAGFSEPYAASAYGNDGHAIDPDDIRNGGSTGPGNRRAVVFEYAPGQALLYERRDRYEDFDLRDRRFVGSTYELVDAKRLDPTRSSSSRRQSYAHIHLFEPAKLQSQASSQRKLVMALEILPVTGSIAAFHKLREEGNTNGNLANFGFALASDITLLGGAAAKGTRWAATVAKAEIATNGAAAAYNTGQTASSLVDGKFREAAVYGGQALFDILGLKAGLDLRRASQSAPDAPKLPDNFDYENYGGEFVDDVADGHRRAEANPLTDKDQTKHTPDVRTLNPVPDPARPVYKQGHPGKPVVDHIRARAANGHPTDPGNLHVKPWEWNSRKGAYEGQLIEARQKYIDQGLTPAQADELLEPEWRWLMNDVIPRPMAPNVLDTVPFPGSR